MILKIDNIELKKVEKSDAQRLAEIANEKEIWRNLKDTYPFPYSEKDAIDFITHSNETEYGSSLGIYLDNLLVGIIGVSRLSDIYRKTGLLGYWVAADQRNKGIISKSIPIIVEYAFSVMNLARVDALVYEYNPASIKVLEKCGFTLEAISRKAAFKDNQLIDIHRYYLINPKYS